MTPTSRTFCMRAFVHEWVSFALQGQMCVCVKAFARTLRGPGERTCVRVYRHRTHLIVRSRSGGGVVF